MDVFEAMQRVSAEYKLRVGEMIARCYPGQSPYSVRDERLVADLMKMFPFAFEKEGEDG